MSPLVEFCIWVLSGTFCTLVLAFIPTSSYRPFRRKENRYHLPFHSFTLPNMPETTVITQPTVPPFRATRLTSTAFLIVEHSDIYDEHPFIYLKYLNDSTILIIDTGCGGKPKKLNVTPMKLRDFIETVNVEDNGGKPLNEGGRRKYLVVLSHCHYDHILGVEEFAQDSQVLVSAYNPDFISPSKLPKHSLCESLGVDVPKYSPTFVSNLFSIPAEGENHIIVVHTPGHTPDELALWDESEKMLYVGDTLYQWAPIIFPSEGSIVAWIETLEMLLNIVTPHDDARISCGHVTAGEPAKQVILDAKGFMKDVLEGRIKPVKRFEKRGEEFVYYVREDGLYSLACPWRLIAEARPKSV